MSHIPNESTSPFPKDALPQKASEVPHAYVGRRHLRSAILSALFILVLTIGLATTLYFIRVPQDIRNRAVVTGPKLSIEPSAKRVKTGESFPLGISLVTGDDTVSAVELHLTYDPSAVEFLSFKHGDKFSVVLEAETHGNGKMKATLGTQPTAPFKGAALLGTITLKQVSSKTSSIAFAPETKVASIGKMENSLAGTGKGDIIIDGSTATLLTPTPTSKLQNQLLPTPTAATGEQPQKQNSFGSLTTTSQPLVTTINYIPPQQTISQSPSQPQAYTPTPSPAPRTTSTNFIENVFISIGTLLQKIFSSLNIGN